MKTKLILLFALVSCTLFAQQTTYRVDNQKSQIKYSAKHKLHAWEGVNNNLMGIAIVNEADQLIEKLALVVNVSDFDSSNSNRDAHSLEVLEALSYPTVKFYATAVDLKTKEISLKGELTFHGITKEITANTKIEVSEESIVLFGEFSLKPSEYQIKLPSFLSIPIKDDIKLNFKVVLD